MSGEEVVKKEILKPLMTSIEETSFEMRKGSAKDFRKKIERITQVQGWTGKVKIDKNAGITITSMKENVGLCVQTGNVGRFYSDIIKLQTLYLNGKIESGVYIIPTKESALRMGDNLTNYERVTSELVIYKKIITIPIFVIGVD